MQSLTILFHSLLWFYYLSGKQWENHQLGLSLTVLICGAKPSSLKACFCNSLKCFSCIRHGTTDNEGFRNEQIWTPDFTSQTRLSALHADIQHCSRHLPTTCSVWGETQVHNRTTSKQFCSFSWDDGLLQVFVLEDYIFWDETNKWVGWILLSNQME